MLPCEDKAAPPFSQHACRLYTLILNYAFLLSTRHGNRAAGQCWQDVPIEDAYLLSPRHQQQLLLSNQLNGETWQGDASPAPLLMHTNGKACLFSHFFCLSPSSSGGTLWQPFSAITCVLTMLSTYLASVRSSCQAVDYLLAPIMMRTGEFSKISRKDCRTWTSQSAPRGNRALNAWIIKSRLAN